MRRIFKIVLFCLVGYNAYAQNGFTESNKSRHKEYHVSVNGNNSNDGSQAKPFKTISAAANVAMPGDVITVHAGVYREQITPPRGGTSNAKRITYQAAKGEKVIIKGSEIVKKWENVGNDTWKAVVPNTMFANHNPFDILIKGDWFIPKDRQHHTGCVYLNGKWLMEAAKKEAVIKEANAKDPLWFAEVDAQNTTIYAQFVGVDPNKELVEVNARETIFYPKKNFVNYITVKGFTMCQAATNWAPPTAEQKGLIGTNWSKGWIIENNDISYSKCSGVALGKYGDEWDNKDTESAKGYVGTINRALANKWNKENIGGHIVRNNTIAFCEQTGIVGSMGCAFSTISGNTIHDIHMKKLFSGYEMAGIKFHGAVDVQIIGNHIYRATMGVWLDWMAQGIQLKNNLMHDNDLDIFLEVNHGPMMVYNNILLSKICLFMNSRGAVFAHNIFGGKMNIISYDSRLTPYHKPHSTDIVDLHDNPAGDIQMINNLFVNGGDASQYKKNILPVTFDGNVYTKGSVRAVSGNKQRSFGEISDEAKEKIKNVPDVDAVEKNFIANENFNADAKLMPEGNKMYLEITLDKNWLTQQKRKLVTTGILGKAIVPNLPFENTDGSPLKIDTDYLGKKRNVSNPSPGSFEILKNGKQRIRVW